jgi:prevent-host-death family protein
MRERTVGIRELKANLSACLRHVKSGDTIVINERGKPIGRIYPIETPLEDKLHDGVRARYWSWNGRKWQPSALKVKTRGKVLVSDLLLEDRR